MAAVLARTHWAELGAATIGAAQPIPPPLRKGAALPELGAATLAPGCI